MKTTLIVALSIVALYGSFAVYAVTRPDTTRIVTTHWRYFRDSVQVSDTMLIAKTLRDTTITTRADTIKGKPIQVKKSK